MTTTSHKKDFPALRRRPRPAYLDSAASTLVPQMVIDALTTYYRDNGANVARGVYRLSADATAAYEDARREVADFLGTSANTVVFTSGATAGLNMAAYGLAHAVTRRHNIVVTAADHHANFVPWQRMAAERGADFRVVAVTADGHIDMDDLAAKIDRHTVVVAFPFVSNVLGTINPVAAIVTAVKRIAPDAITVVDAAQAAAHLPIDLRALGCDLLVVAGHKMYGPTGIGILAGTRATLDMLEPLLVGGEMVDQVSAIRTTYKDVPTRLEAGTPPIADALGLAAAVRYIRAIGWDTIRAHDSDLITYATTQLTRIGDTVTIIGTANPRERAALIAFTVAGVHPHDLAQILDDRVHVAVRAGFHCAQPLHRDALGIGATTRLSVGIYNDRADIDALIDGIAQAVTTLSTRR